MMFNTPQPNDGFEWVQAICGRALVCRPLAEIAAHVFTTREWPLGRTHQSEDQGWKTVAEALHVEGDHLARPRQVHGVRAVVAEQAMVQRPAADIIINDRPDLAVAVQTADCVPILVADCRTGAVGAVHAGWRGLAAGVPRIAVSTLAAKFGSRPADLVAAIGPAIGSCCYEVGEDVWDAFGANFEGGRWTRWFSTTPAATRRNPSIGRVLSRPRAAENRWFFDTAAAARDQLRAAGVPPQQIFATDLCTASHPEVFCSFRRDGSPAGRMAAAIKAPGKPPDP
jgi:hypothetical protein